MQRFSRSVLFCGDSDRMIFVISSNVSDKSFMFLFSIGCSSLAIASVMYCMICSHILCVFGCKVCGGFHCKCQRRSLNSVLLIIGPLMR